MAASLDDPVRGGIFAAISPVSLALSLAALAVAYNLALSFHSAFFGPLSKVPGPRINAFSTVPHMIMTFRGQDSKTLPELHRKYGQIVRVAPNYVSLTGGKEMWKQIHGFPKAGKKDHGAGAFTLDAMFYHVPIMEESGLSSANNDVHARVRKVVTHGFSDKALKEQEPLLKEWAWKLKSKLSEFAEADQPTDIHLLLNCKLSRPPSKATRCTTFDVMGDLSFAQPLNMLANAELVPWVKLIFEGMRSNTQLRAVRSLSDWTNDLIWYLMGAMPPVLATVRQQLDFVHQRVEHRMNTIPDRPDIWTRILEKSEGPEGITRNEHDSVAFSFMVAGTETTATSLSGTIFYLMQHPEHYEKLRDDIRGNFSSFQDLTLEPLQAHRYLDSILKESLRMYPPAPLGFPRRSPPGGAVINGYFVPESVQLAIHHKSTYSQETNFLHADEFHPERWSGDAKYKDDNFDCFEPFSVGPRGCLGKNLAWHEMRILLATILLHFDIELLPESQNWMNQKVYTLWEKGPLMVKLTEVNK